MARRLSWVNGRPGTERCRSALNQHLCADGVRANRINRQSIPRRSALPEIFQKTLFACLNTPIVKRQIKAKQFTQDIIDTLGKRFTEIMIPVPKDQATANKIARETQEIIEGRAKLRNRAKAITLELQGPAVRQDDLDVLEET